MKCMTQIPVPPIAQAAETAARRAGRVSVRGARPGGGDQAEQRAQHGHA